MKKRDDNKNRAKTPEEIRKDLIARGLVTPAPVKVAQGLTYKIADPVEPIPVLGVFTGPSEKS